MACIRCRWCWGVLWPFTRDANDDDGVLVALTSCVKLCVEAETTAIADKKGCIVHGSKAQLMCSAYGCSNVEM